MRMRWTGHETCVREKKYVQGSGGKTEGRRPVGSPRFSWESDIVMDFKETGWENMDSIHVV
jgi:hypothetical protein